MKRDRRMWLPVAALVMAASLLAAPALAGAQAVSPTTDQYEPFPEQIEEVVGVGVQPDERVPADEAAPPPERDRVVAALPFTGLDIALLAAAAALLGASGLVLRRLARPSGENG